MQEKCHTGWPVSFCTNFSTVFYPICNQFAAVSNWLKLHTVDERNVSSRSVCLIRLVLFLHLPRVSNYFVTSPRLSFSDSIFLPMFPFLFLEIFILFNIPMCPPVLRYTISTDVHFSFFHFWRHIVRHKILFTCINNSTFYSIFTECGPLNMTDNVRSGCICMFLWYRSIVRFTVVVIRNRSCN